MLNFNAVKIESAEVYIPMVKADKDDEKYGEKQQYVKKRRITQLSPRNY